ncbi:hypothetical protein ACWEU6_37170 [Streptosporangium sandarakinum]|uniref:hypothetical protein n=1 Tax=Streptosporangium sandarakinum TaxID=1260955 RepID=UPI0036953797
MTEWLQRARVASAVGAGALILGGVPAAYADVTPGSAGSMPGEVAADAPAVAAGDPAAASGVAADELRFRLWLRGAGDEAWLAVSSKPAEALKDVDCPRGAAPVVEGAPVAEGPGRDVPAAAPDAQGAPAEGGARAAAFSPAGLPEAAGSGDGPLAAAPAADAPLTDDTAGAAGFRGTGTGPATGSATGSAVGSAEKGEAVPAGASGIRDAGAGQVTGSTADSAADPTAGSAADTAGAPAGAPAESDRAGGALSCSMAKAGEHVPVDVVLRAPEEAQEVQLTAVARIRDARGEWVTRTARTTMRLPARTAQRSDAVDGAVDSAAEGTTSGAAAPDGRTPVPGSARSTDAAGAVPGSGDSGDVTASDATGSGAGTGAGEARVTGVQDAGARSAGAAGSAGDSAGVAATGDAGDAGDAVRTGTGGAEDVAASTAGTARAPQTGGSALTGAAPEAMPGMFGERARDTGQAAGMLPDERTNLLSRPGTALPPGRPAAQSGAALPETRALAADPGSSSWPAGSEGRGMPMVLEDIPASRRNLPVYEDPASQASTVQEPGAAPGQGSASRGSARGPRVPRTAMATQPQAVPGLQGPRATLRNGAAQRGARRQGAVGMRLSPIQQMPPQMGQLPVMPPMPQQMPPMPRQMPVMPQQMPALPQVPPQMGQPPMFPQGQIPPGQMPVPPRQPGQMGQPGQLGQPPAQQGYPQPGYPQQGGLGAPMTPGVPGAPVAPGVPGAPSPLAMPPGAPLPQELDGSNTKIESANRSSSVLSDVRGLPAVGAAVGGLLLLLWLRMRIQRRRNWRPVS